MKNKANEKSQHFNNYLKYFGNGNGDYFNVGGGG